MNRHLYQNKLRPIRQFDLHDLPVDRCDMLHMNTSPSLPHYHRLPGCCRRDLRQNDGRHLCLTLWAPGVRNHVTQPTPP